MSPPRPRSAGIRFRRGGLAAVLAIALALTHAAAAGSPERMVADEPRPAHQAQEPRRPPPVHPWADTLPPRSPDTPPAPPALEARDALDLSLSLRAAPGVGSIGAALRARYRLDADAHVGRLLADAHDLGALERGVRSIEERNAALGYLARRCEEAWRGWQAALVAAATVADQDPTQSAYLGALAAALALDAGPPADAVTMNACRLEPWTDDLEFLVDAPESRVAAAQQSLSGRSARIIDAVAPPTLWLEIDVSRRTGGPGGPGLAARPGLLEPASVEVSIRGGLELPFTLAGDGAVNVGIHRQGPELTVTWRSQSLDERARPPAAAVGAPQSDPLAERREAFERRALEARVVRADASRRWWAACGDDAPAALPACLEPAVAAAGLREDLLGAIDAELAAIRAVLAWVEASGRDPRDLLRSPAR